MEEVEIRAEIERRKRRVKDLGLREIIWRLHNSVLKPYQPEEPRHGRRASFFPEIPKSHPALLYPEIRDSIKFSDQGAEFQIGPTTYLVRCQQRFDSLSGRGHRSVPHDESIAVIMYLKVNGEAVFTFHVARTTTYGTDGIYINERMGEIVRFIEGPWIADIPDLLVKIKNHETVTRNSWQPQRKAEEKLQADRRSFGL